jgi:hypothetical protein
MQVSIDAARERSDAAMIDRIHSEPDVEMQADDLICATRQVSGMRYSDLIDIVDCVDLHKGLPVKLQAEVLAHYRQEAAAVLAGSYL